jgi:ketosteroid isomerase-like protein
MLTLFTEEVERWEVGSPKRTRGKIEFENEVLPGPEVARLGMQVDKVIEEGDTVVAEGLAQISKKDGSTIKVQFCDIFEFRGEKIRRITAYGAVVE